jgi:hypothetical protein
VSEHRSSSSRWLDREEASIYAPIDLCDGALELPVLGVVTAPTAVLVRTDGYGAWGGAASWYGSRTRSRLVRSAREPLNKWHNRHGVQKVCQMCCVAK